MKSLALSLLVAVGLSLGAASASAEMPPVVVPTAHAVNMHEAARLAREHAERANQYRVTARLEAQKARDCLRIAADNDKQGFPYYAKKMREKAAMHQQAAFQYENRAEREEALARHYRALAMQSQAQKPAVRS